MKLIIKHKFNDNYAIRLKNGYYIFLATDCIKEKLLLSYLIKLEDKRIGKLYEMYRSELNHYYNTPIEFEYFKELLYNATEYHIDFLDLRSTDGKEIKKRLDAMDINVLYLVAKINKRIVFKPTGTYHHYITYDMIMVDEDESFLIRIKSYSGVPHEIRV